MEIKKGFYQGMPVRFWKGKYWVIPKDGGAWKEYAGKLSEIKEPEEEKKTERFFKIEHTFFEKDLKDLTTIEKMIMITLISHKNEKNGGKIWPSIKRISLLSGVSKKTIYKKLPKLLKKFNIRKERIYGEKNIYFFE